MTDASAPVFDTPRLQLRQLQPSDAAALYAYRSLAEVRQFQSWAPGDERDALNWIAAMQDTPFNQPDSWFQFGLYAKSTNQLIGDLGVHFPAGDTHQAEVGITIVPDFQGQGLAGEALGAVIDHLFHSLGKHRVYASIDPANTASKRLLESIGMRLEAHFRQSLRLGDAWVDDMVFAVLRSEWREPPAC
jgi:RimJ/RimL family protein N-acetyltransferase